jgi:hypothetical protein
MRRDGVTALSREIVEPDNKGARAAASTLQRF